LTCIISIDRADFVIFVMPTQNKHSAHIRSAGQINSLAYKLTKTTTPKYINSQTYQLTNSQTLKLINSQTHKLINS